MKISLQKLQKRALEELKPDTELIVLSMFSSLIASFGIKNGNIYIMIGAMLVSPLFDPIISLVVLLRLKKHAQAIRSFWTLLMLFFITLITSALFWLIYHNSGTPIDISETVSILTIDNFILALFMGIIGMLLWIWPKSSETSAGLAIAISLVPPIAYSMYYLTMSDWGMFLVFIEIFGVNLLGIIIGAYVTIRFYKRI